MEANLTHYRLFQEKKNRVGLTFPLFPLLIAPYYIPPRGQEGPFPLIQTFLPPLFPLRIGYFVKKGT